MKKFIFIYVIAAGIIPAIAFLTEIGSVSSKTILTDSLIINTIDSLQLRKEKEARLLKGKELYESKCQKCHTLYEPSEFRLKKWTRNLNEMRRKAELTSEQYNLILDYITENCKK